MGVVQSEPDHPDAHEHVLPAAHVPPLLHAGEHAVQVLGVVEEHDDDKYCAEVQLAEPQDRHDVAEPALGLYVFAPHAVQVGVAVAEHEPERYWPALQEDVHGEHEVAPSALGLYVFAPQATQVGVVVAEQEPVIYWPALQEDVHAEHEVADPADGL